MDGAWQTASTGDASAPPSGVVGPNAVIQLAEAMRAAEGEAATQHLFASAGQSALLDAPPEAMIDERIPRALFDAFWRAWPADVARAVSDDAGRRVADYIIAHRIPRLAQRVLALLPAGPATDLLMTAIQHHAWTFAGSGLCRIQRHPTRLISISDNPLTMPDSVWHAAVLTRLFQRLASARAAIRLRACCHDGAEACQFEIALTPRG